MSDSKVSKGGSIGADWADVYANPLNLSEGALDWAGLHQLHNEMGEDAFQAWLQSDEFGAMIDHDLALNLFSEDDQKRRKFQFINPERLRDYIIENGADGVQPWHLKLMRRLDRISKGTTKTFNQIVASGVLDKKSIRGLKGLSFDAFWELPLGTDLHVISDDLDNVLFLREELKRLEEILKSGDCDDRDRDAYIKTKQKHDKAADPWRVAYGASFERILNAKRVQNRLHRMHNIMPQGVIQDVLEQKTFIEALGVEMCLDRIDAMDNIWDSSPLAVDRISNNFRDAVLELRGEDIPPVHRDTLEERFERRMRLWREYDEQNRPREVEGDKRTIAYIRAEEAAAKRAKRPAVVNAVLGWFGYE